MSFEGKPETAVRQCYECGGSGTVLDGQRRVPCKRCNGTGQIRSNA